MLIQILRSVFKRYDSARGDTIVEVLLCIAIVGAVITGAYALASHSLQESLSSSEHTQATKLAQGQIEALKFREKNTTSNDASDSKSWGNAFAKATNFCLNTSTLSEASPDWLPVQNGNATFSPENLSTTATHYNTSCVQNNSKYYINVTTPDGATVDNGVFLVTVRWEAPGGGPQSQTQLYYKFPSKLTVTPPGVAPTPIVAVTLGASPSTINAGSSSTLTWSSANATSCTASGAWSGNKATSGSQSVSPAGTSTYTLTCTGLAGSDNDNATITVNPHLPRVALYRCYQYYLYLGNPKQLTNHKYSTDSSLCQDNLHDQQPEGIMGYAPKSTNAGAQPVYNTYSSAQIDDFYTMSSSERNNSINLYGYTSNKGIAFYAYPYNGSCSVAGTVPIYRYYSAVVGNHFYTTKATENPNSFYAVDGGGSYISEGITGCVFSSP